jgi:hypothetical protein
MPKKKSPNISEKEFREIGLFANDTPCSFSRMKVFEKNKKESCFKFEELLWMVEVIDPEKKQKFEKCKKSNEDMVSEEIKRELHLSQNHDDLKVLLKKSKIQIEKNISKIKFMKTIKKL